MPKKGSPRRRPSHSGSRTRSRARQSTTTPARVRSSPQKRTSGSIVASKVALQPTLGARAPRGRRGRQSSSPRGRRTVRAKTAFPELLYFEQVPLPIDMQTQYDNFNLGFAVIRLPPWFSRTLLSCPTGRSASPVTACIESNASVASFLMTLTTQLATVISQINTCPLMMGLMSLFQADSSTQPWPAALSEANTPENQTNRAMYVGSGQLAGFQPVIGDFLASPQNALNVAQLQGIDAINVFPLFHPAKKIQLALEWVNAMCDFAVLVQLASQLSLPALTQTSATPMTPVWYMNPRTFVATYLPWMTRFM